MTTFHITFSDGLIQEIEATCKLSACIAATAAQLRVGGEVVIVEVNGVPCNTYLWLAKVPLPLRVRLMDHFIIAAFWSCVAIALWWLVGLAHYL